MISSSDQQKPSFTEDNGIEYTNWRLLWNLINTLLMQYYVIAVWIWTE